MRKISNAIDLSYYTVKGVLVKNGVYKSTMLPKDLLKVRNDKIIELYNQGNNLNQIAKPMKINRETARYVLIKNGIYRYPGLQNELKIERNNKIIEWYKEGKSIKEISGLIKLSFYPIKNILIKKGLFTSQKLPSDLALKRNKKIAHLYKSGKSPSRIAETMSLEYTSIRQILIKEGIYKFNAPRDRSRNIERNKRIVKLYKSGKHVKVIAKEVDLTPLSVRDILIRQGAYVLYEYSHLNDERNKKIVALYKKGHSVYSLSKSLKVCYNTIRNALIKKDAYNYIQERTIKRYKKKK